MNDQAPAPSGQGAPDGVASTTALLNPPAPAQPANTPGPNWLEGADETTTGYVQNKGWDKPTQVLDAYRNLEKLMGADRAGNTVVLPKADAPQADIDAFYNRLGRPATPNDYKLVPDGVTPTEFTKAAAAKMHELGLNTKQGAELAAFFNAQTEGAKASLESQKATTFQQEALDLKTEWGNAYTQKLAEAQAATRGLGLDEATLDKMEASMGHKALMQLMAKIGSKTGESDFVTGAATEKFGNMQTPAQAKATIQSRMADKNFTARYLNKDSEAVAEMKRLHEQAFPEGQ